FHPDETEITSSTGQFEPAIKPSRESLLGRLHHSIVLVRPTELWQKAALAAIVGAGIGIFFFAYRRRGVAGAAITAAVGLVLALVVAWNFTLSSSMEKSSSVYFADASRGLSPSEAPVAFR